MLIQELRAQCEALRRSELPLFAVSNREWYSLFRDEIRNSIAIEGIFANRNDLLNVLENKGRTSVEKTAAILGYFEAVKKGKLWYLKVRDVQAYIQKLSV